jgi:hypothetical protein
MLSVVITKVNHRRMNFIDLSTIQQRGCVNELPEAF